MGCRDSLLGSARLHCYKSIYLGKLLANLPTLKKPTLKEKEKYPRHVIASRSKRGYGCRNIRAVPYPPNRVSDIRQ